MAKTDITQRDARTGQRTIAPLAKAAWTPKFPEKVCRVFVESGLRDLHAIIHATRQRDQEALLACIHSMKGALLMLGETYVAGQCVTLERSIESKGIDEATSHLETLEEQMRDLLQRYAEACETNK